jgi:hypothetical protein
VPVGSCGRGFRKMPYKDPEKRRLYQLLWAQARRTAWIEANGPCKACGSDKDLQVDHKDRSTKVDHKVWSWREVRRIAELSKCQVLCKKCHINKTHAERGDRIMVHGTLFRGYQRGCKCLECRSANAHYERQRRIKIRSVQTDRGKPVEPGFQVDRTRGQHPPGPPRNVRARLRFDG